jgi:hypothetical protein
MKLPARLPCRGLRRKGTPGRRGVYSTDLGPLSVEGSVVILYSACAPVAWFWLRWVRAVDRVCV